MVKKTYSYSATVNTIKTWRPLPVARVQLLVTVWLGLILLRGSVSRQSSFALTLVTEAVQCEVLSTHIQTNKKCSWHAVVKNETQPLFLLLFCSWDRISALMYLSPIMAQRRPAYEQLSFRYERSIIRTPCRSAALPVGGLQRPCRTRLLSLFWELVGSGRTSFFII